MDAPAKRFVCEPRGESHGEGETLAGSVDLECVVAQVVARFVRRYAPPARYDRAEWQAECNGEAWRCVADALRTFDPARGGVDWRGMWRERYGGTCWTFGHGNVGGQGGCAFRWTRLQKTRGTREGSVLGQTLRAMGWSAYWWSVLR
ncbi:MAG: hypothetical protein RMK45_02230 [Armatimonadota bacterium]|nr:hypothetical protein [Armatimonadota bacterium]